MPRVLRAIEAPTTFQGVPIGAFGLRVRRLQGSVWRAAIPSPNFNGALKPAGRSHDRLLMHFVTPLPVHHRHSQDTVLPRLQASVLLSNDRAAQRDASARVATPLELAVVLTFELCRIAIPLELAFELCHKLSLVMPPRVLVHEYEAFI